MNARQLYFIKMMFSVSHWLNYLAIYSVPNFFTKRLIYVLSLLLCTGTAGADKFILDRSIDAFQTDVTVDYRRGFIEVKTIAEGSRAKENLRLAIETLLTTPVDPALLDIDLAREFGLTGRPFLQGLVRDHEGVLVQYPWRARRYAQHLVNTALHAPIPLKSVRFPMVTNLRHAKASQYRSIVNHAAQQYGVDPALIFAIIETESSFNPFAESPSKAYGLMQVMRKTAGRDVFQKVFNKDKTPSKRYLLKPKNNVLIGTAYLSLLSDRYLGKIRHHKTREYCMIAAYNGGAGLLLESFHKNRNKAIRRINAMSPSEVFSFIVNKHKKNETRQYLKKVTERKAFYVP